MEVLKVRKNLLLDRQLIDRASVILNQKHKNFTEAIQLYFQAIVKDPSLLDTIEHTAKKRTGGFIGMLDGAVLDTEYRAMKKDRYEDLS